MSKLVLVIFIFLIYLFHSPFVFAQTISDIGDLKVGESKIVTISNLEHNAKYYWGVSKLIEAVPVKQYSPVFRQCFYSDNNGEFVAQIKPSSVGLYKLTIYRVYVSDCRPVNNPAASQDFSVGGATRQDCCVVLLRYDRDKDVCTTITIPNPLVPQPTIEVPTECSKTDPKSYCEPESLQCFKTKTLVLRGKICWQGDPKDNFDKDRYVICGTSGGTQCGTRDDPAISTAIGCIRTSPVGLIQDLLKFIIAISGGLAFLMMLLGAFQMITSAGNPETLQAGRDRFQSAIIGLLFVIFAVLLLKIIGVDILGLGTQFGIKP